MPDLEHKKIYLNCLHVDHKFKSSPLDGIRQPQHIRSDDSRLDVTKVRGVPFKSTVSKLDQEIANNLETTSVIRIEIHLKDKERDADLDGVVEALERGYAGIVV